MFDEQPDGDPHGECAAEIQRLTAEVANLKTVMVAAAEEIHRHWAAHCDADGYGPANLMRRLEEGIPSEYGYTAGAFTKLTADHAAHAQLMKFYGVESIDALIDAQNQHIEKLQARLQPYTDQAVFTRVRED